MKKDYYMHQSFLLNYDYDNDSVPCSTKSNNEFIQDFTESINLFDTEEITRKVNFSYLLKEIDTIIKNYKNETLKAFSHKLRLRFPCQTRE